MKTGFAVLLKDAHTYNEVNRTTWKAGTLIEIRMTHSTFADAYAVLARRPGDTISIFLADLTEDDIRYLSPLELLALCAQ